MDEDDLYSSDTPKKSSSGSQISSTYESLSSGYHDRTVDDTAIDGDDYVYRGDSRVITGARRRASGRLRRSGSMTDLGDDFSSNRTTNTSYLTPTGYNTSTGYTATGYNSPSSAEEDSRFFSAGDSSTRSSFHSASSYTRTGVSGTIPSDTLTSTRLTGMTSETQTAPSWLTYRGSASASLLGDSREGGSGSGSATQSTGSPYTYSSTYGSSPYTMTSSYGSSPYTDSLTVSSGSPSRSTLSRTGGVRRRAARTPESARSYSSSGSGYTPGSEEVSDKENTTDSADYSNDTFTPTGSYTTLGESYTSGGTYTSGSGSGSGSGSYTHSDETGEYHSVLLILRY